MTTFIEKGLVGGFAVGTLSGGSGKSVSISADGNVVAVGEPNFDSGGFTDNGRVRVFEFKNGTWVNKGLADGFAVGVAVGISGSSVSISTDGNVVAVGEPGYRYSSGGFTDIGRVRVFEFTDNEWVNKGQADGFAFGTFNYIRSGTSVSISGGGNVVAVGGNGSAIQTSPVKVFEFIGSEWIEKGGNGAITYTYTDASVSISENGNIVAIGDNGYDNPNGLNNVGRVIVFEFKNGVWVEKGSVGGFAFGDTLNSYSGYSVSISRLGDIVASCSSRGVVKVFEFKNGVWVEKGNTGDFVNGGGGSVSISDDGNIVAVGDSAYDYNGMDNVGRASVFEFKNGKWVEKGIVGGFAFGDNEKDRSGSSVSISRYGNIVAVGESGFESDKGRTRVFEFPSPPKKQPNYGISQQQSRLDNAVWIVLLVFAVMLAAAAIIYGVI